MVDFGNYFRYNFFFRPAARQLLNIETVVGKHMLELVNHLLIELPRCSLEVSFHSVQLGERQCEKFGISEHLHAEPTLAK